MSATNELEKLKLVSKVVTELDNNYNMKDQDLGASLQLLVLRAAEHDVRHT
jgi:hypothetical protein